LNVFFVEFLATYNCDQNCYYCDIINKGINTYTEMDMDKFKWTIDILGSETKNLMVEICGGETGLISNVEDVIRFLKDHKSVKKTQIMSNGLLRVQHPEIIKEFDYYNEHLVRDIIGRDVQKFHDIEFCSDDNAKTVIVMTENTVRSLLENEEYYRDIIESESFWFKIFIERSVDISTNHLDMMREFYNKYNVMFCDFYMNKLEMKNDSFSKSLCTKYPFLPVIDMENNDIIHCAYYNFTNKVTKDLNENNLRDLVNKKLFITESPDYCCSCYDYYQDPHFLIRRNKSNKQL